MKNIAILGAAGRLGQVAALQFHKAGYQVTAISRSGYVEGLPFSIRQMKADALDETALARATEGADFIFNSLNPVYTDWKDKALPMARNVMQAAKTHGATHLFPGNIYVYGKDMPEILKETTPFSSSTGKGDIRIRMETLFKTRAENEGIKTRIIRAGDFFGGPGKGSWFDLVLCSKLSGSKFLYPGRADIPHAWAYLPDFADAFVKLAGEEDRLSAYECFTFEGHTLTGKDILSLLETILNRPLSMSGLPWPLLTIGGLIHPMWREVAEMKYLWFKPHQLDGTELERTIGARLQTPAIEAFRTALKDLDLLLPEVKAA